MCTGSEAGSYLRLIYSCITQLKVQGPSWTCNESEEEERRRRTVSHRKEEEEDLCGRAAHLDARERALLLIRHPRQPFPQKVEREPPQSPFVLVKMVKIHGQKYLVKIHGQKYRNGHVSRSAALAKRKWRRWEGYHERRRCSRDNYPESYITKYTSIRRKNINIYIYICYLRGGVCAIVKLC